MKVLMITGDRRIFERDTEAHTRFKLQQGAVEELKAVFWGKGALVTPLLISGKFDVVTSQDPFWRGLVAWFLARRLGARLNIQVHTDFEAEARAKPIRRILGQFILRHADSVRVVSEKIKRQIERYTQVRIKILPVFLDLEKFRHGTRQEHPSKNILWVGRLEGEKNPLEAIAVLKKVRQAGIDAKLIMLGKGALENEVSRRAEGLRVEILGWKADPAPYLEVADVVLCTSKYESFGASIVEALAAGVPVVAPDVGVAREAGAIVVPRERLAETVIEMLQSTRPIRGELKLKTLSREEWAKRWRETL